MDAVEEAGSGHPGTAMSLAPAAYLLFQRLLRHDPADPTWIGRDRFVLSCGHSSLTLYIQLFLSGYGLTMEDLKLLRTWGSLTPGHPEHGHTLGVEVTTGPLGQGIGNAVGMAMAQRYERGLFDPDAAPGESVFDHTIWCFASDGDIEEGISSEASSIAGHQQLGNLVLLYDDNHISIEGDTRVALSEDVAARYEAYGWHVQHVADINDVEAIYDAFVAARDETARPSLISVRSVIGWPAPDQGRHRQGPRLRARRRRGREDQGDPRAWTRRSASTARTRCSPTPARWSTAATTCTQQWQTRFDAWAAAHPAAATELDRISQRRLPDGLGRQAAGLRRRDLDGDPQGQWRGDQRDRCRSCRSSGAARPTSRRATSPRSRAPTRSCPRRTAGRRTGGSCTSGSANTRWARS